MVTRLGNRKPFDIVTFKLIYFILPQKKTKLITLIIKRCYTCINCNRPQLDKLQVFVGFDRQLYCKTCYPKIWHTPLPLESTSKIKADPGDCSGCPRCGGKVFEAEKMACRSGWYHKLCFSCKICKRLMDYSTFVDYKVHFYSTFLQNSKFQT